MQKIKAQAEVRRNTQNEGLKGVAELIKEVTLVFAAKAGETGKLYGSITTQDIAAALTEKIRYEIKRQQVDTQPIRTLGEFTAHVRLTMDLIPEFKIIVHREGESPESVTGQAEPEKAEKPKKGSEAKTDEPAAEPSAETA
ncbi:MAG: hypothetical protein HND47_22560 [Chloroflexi bacterium]|nr:hypothetical protein [Chloroflexota bacterium]